MNSLFKGLFFLILIIGTAILLIKNFTIMKTYRGTVIEHNTTSDRGGNIDYYTIAKFEDGTIRSLRGLDYYVKPIGETVYYTIREFK